MDFIKDLELGQFFDTSSIHTAIRIAIIGIVGYVLVRLLLYSVKKLLFKNLSQQHQLIFHRLIVYSGTFVITTLIFSELGIEISTILGAAGILGIVIGIASQTSLGNIISGIFLISEKAFEIGDILKIDDKTGVVYDIELLSIKLKTFDNVLIRIPNQTLISTQFINITKFPVRRLDINLQIAYKEDIKKAKALLIQVAENNPLCLDEPVPTFQLNQFGPNGIELKFGVWFEKENLIKVKNEVIQQIKETFDNEGIEIPFPHQKLYFADHLPDLNINVKSMEQN